MISALGRQGAEARLCQDAETIRKAKQVVLPGVGTFGAAMSRLKELSLIEALKERILKGAPTLCVCVGFQVLFEQSEESSKVAGLGVFPGKIIHFPTSVRVPQFGWNRIHPQQNDGMLKEGYAYFANSYCATQAPEHWAYAKAHHGMDFIAAIEKGAVLGCQFHPELSSAFGLELLSRWLESSREQAC